MYSTGPASIALTEANPGGLTTYHFKDRIDCVRALLHTRPWFDLLIAEIEEAKQIWEECDKKDAEADAEVLERRRWGSIIREASDD